MQNESGPHSKFETNLNYTGRLCLKNENTYDEIIGLYFPFLLQKMSYKCLDIFCYVEGLEKARQILQLLFLPNANDDICFSPTDIFTDKYDIFFAQHFESLVKFFMMLLELFQLGHKIRLCLG